MKGYIDREIPPKNARGRGFGYAPNAPGSSPPLFSINTKSYEGYVLTKTGPHNGERRALPM
jgi:hypothetical protein